MYYEAVKHYAKQLRCHCPTNTQQLMYVDSMLNKVQGNRNELPSIVACMLGTMGKNNSIFCQGGLSF